MKYHTLEEVKKVLNENPLPFNFSSLSSEEQEKYYKIIKDVMLSYKLDSGISYDDYFYLLSQYVSNQDGNEEFITKYSEFFFTDFSSYMQDEFLRVLNNGMVANNELCDFLNEIVYISDSLFNQFPKVLEKKDEMCQKYDEIFSLIVKQNEDLVEYYRGTNPQYYEMMLNKGTSFRDVHNIIRELPIDDIIHICEYLLDNGYSIDKIIKSRLFLINNVDYEIVKLLISREPDYLFKYLGEDSLLRIEFFAKSLEKNEFNDPFLHKLLKTYPIEKFLLTAAISADKLSVEAINFIYQEKFINDSEYHEYFEKIVQKNPKAFMHYMGNLLPIEIRNFMASDSIIVDEEFVLNLNNLFNGPKSKKISEKLYSYIFKKIVNQNSDFVKYYIGYDYEIYKIAIQNGSTINRDLLISVLINNDNILEEDLKKIFEMLNIKPFNYLVLKSYKGNVAKLFDSFEKVDYFLSLSNIDRELFIDYAFASNYNWLDDMIDIFDKNEVNDFLNVKNYFFKNFYNINDNTPYVIRIRNLIDIIKNYHNYPDLCKNIAAGTLSEEDINRLKILFSKSEIIKNDSNDTIKNKDELADIENAVFKNFKLQIETVTKSGKINDTKNLLCMILFNMSFDDVNNKLFVYGNIRDFRQLLFDNRNNPEIANDILEMMVYVSMMEDVVDCNNIDSLNSLLLRIISNKEIYALCQKANMLFDNFDDKMNSFYAREMNSNLTDLSNPSEAIMDKASTTKYGVDVIDLTDKKYCLLEHVKSSKESVECLVNGKANGKQLFISLSLGSNRNQKLYSNDSIIFACSVLPEELFIRSSISNIGSNGMIKEYSYEVDKKRFKTKERGALETSSALENSNSEIFCYRDGLKFEYIVLPNGREPTEEEIEIALKYNLKFVKVQAIDSMIEKPKDIPKPFIDNSRNHQQANMSNDNELLELQSLLRGSNSKGPKKIAIFTDSHALFEPTLAILEDARRSGITEIYSLGDNIGTGPNPKEVMDLLEIYGVKSLKGNHEIYASGELSSVFDHLKKSGAVDEAIRNGGWTRAKLTPEQLEKIKTLPDDYLVEIGGKKILLSHYIHDYNTGEKRNLPSDVDQIFQGHVHFAGQNDNVQTIHGAGIGFKKGEDVAAHYVVLTEKPGGGYDVEVKTVKFNPMSTQYDIIESDMDDADKSKISEWVGGRSK